MESRTIVTVLHAALALSAFAAAGLWFYSIWVTRGHVDKIDENGLVAESITEIDVKGGRIDPFASTAAQAK